MTNKDIRDIAAYWGTMCVFELKYGRRWIVFDHAPVSSFLWETDGKADPFKYGQDSRNLKLHLRPISGMADDEVREAGRRFDCFINPTDKVNRSSSGFYVANRFALDFNGRVQIDCDSESYTMRVETKEFAQLISYLQSVGVYVPGTIDEQYVEII